MISLEKWMILTPLQKLPNNVGNLGKIIVATGFEWLPKVQKIAQYGHTATYFNRRWIISKLFFKIWNNFSLFAYFCSILIPMTNIVWILTIQVEKADIVCSGFEPIP